MRGVETEGHALNRGTVPLAIGSYVGYRKSTYRLTATVDFAHVLGIDVIRGTSMLLPIAELTRASPERVAGPYANYSLDEIADQSWLEAERRMAIIQPLLQGGMFESGAVEARAKKCGVSRSSIYRWLAAYTEGDQFLSLMPGRRGWKEGNSRVSEEVEKIIAEQIRRIYLTMERKTQKDVFEAVKVICERGNLPPPSYPTVAKRIGKIPKRDILRSRGYSKLAQRNEPSPNTFDADYPLHRIQIDHTPGDVILVDDTYRLPIGRPWVTLAIDMYTRMIVGYYLSLSAPSAVSVAMCLVHAMLPKHKWLNLHGIDAKWEVWGKPYEIHSDNGPDFKTRSLIESCSAHGIEREFRPKNQPHWGGKIESLMLTKARAFATLPGATSRNIDERGDVNPDGKAVVSFSAFEKWFIAQIIKYNNKSHSAIENMPPVQKWHEAFFGSSLRKPVSGLPPIPADPMTLEIDFMPSIERTVQGYGVEWNAFYYAEVLRPWIEYKDPGSKENKKFLFRRDPRDINFIWFYEPTERKYHKIPITTGPFPGISVEAYNKAKLKVKKLGLSLQDDEQIRKLTALQQALVAEEAAKSKAARREQQKNKNRPEKKTPASVYMAEENVEAETKQSNTVQPAADAWGDDNEAELYGGVA
ncbi:TPA: transposase [Pseudomonas aeruginosa]|nr:transposase [Pseudomonas aeruginosa]HBP6062326.1 transposase [Pseudomonas aeruginosa]HBP6171839.1 transposase [Pseudomonas aeruginosa]HBP6484748.1 transposase [Pseudomonas aeruginosa]